VTVRAAMLVASLVNALVSPALAQPTYCSTSFQGYRICSGPGGYRSTEWERDGMRFGEDSDGNRWTTSQWQGFETLTGRSRPER
jgi:hypothetical protein